MMRSLDADPGNRHCADPDGRGNVPKAICQPGTTAAGFGGSYGAALIGMIPEGLYLLTSVALARQYGAAGAAQGTGAGYELY